MDLLHVPVFAHHDGETSILVSDEEDNSYVRGGSKVEGQWMAAHQFPMWDDAEEFEQISRHPDMVKVRNILFASVLADLYFGRVEGVEASNGTLTWKPAHDIWVKIEALPFDHPNMTKVVFKVGGANLDIEGRALMSPHLRYPYEILPVREKDLRLGVRPDATSPRHVTCEVVGGKLWYQSFDQGTN